MDKNIFNTAVPDVDEDRVDGIAKVTGKARFTAEHKLENLAYAVFVSSTIAKGAIKTMDTSAAKAAPGVLDIINHLNCPPLPGYNPEFKSRNPSQVLRGLNIFSNNLVRYNGQPIAMVIAETYERAVYAASLVRVEYIRERQHTDFENGMPLAKSLSGNPERSVYKRGEENAWKNAEVKVEAEYILPMETHNPMEMHATIAVWEGDDKLTVYDKSQGPKNTQNDLRLLFGLPLSNIKVITEYVGGAFGSALRSWPHVPAACIAARKVKRPVKMLLNREQMFTMVGYRPYAWQKLGIGATREGLLTGITHDAVANTSTYEEFAEGIVGVSQFLYNCPNVNTSYKLMALDINTPAPMRGPGPATGCFGLESALDELSYLLNMDPIELRIKNHADVHPHSKLPWTSKYLKECYELGKEKIGWKNRPAIPGSLIEEGWLTGYGMGSGVFGAGRGQATVKGILKNDGTLVLQSAVSDMGPGTSTAMEKIAADLMEISIDKIHFEMGDTDLPSGPTQGGSGSSSSLGTAITAICDAFKTTLKELAITTSESFKSSKVEDLKYGKGMITTANGTHSINIQQLLEQAGKPFIEVVKESTRATAEAQKYAMHSFSVHFVKVHVHPGTGQIKIKHIVSTADCGKIISEKTARSQMIGGAVGGVGMALHEETIIDPRYGRYVNANLADYHVPVNADIPKIDVLFVDKPDTILNPMGSKGVGEIALIGVAPAVANAIYNATGKRIRRLPITADKLI